MRRKLIWKPHLCILCESYNMVQYNVHSFYKNKYFHKFYLVSHLNSKLTIENETILTMYLEMRIHKDFILVHISTISSCYWSINIKDYSFHIFGIPVFKFLVFQLTLCNLKIFQQKES